MCQKYIVWGAGEYGKRLSDLLEEESYMIIAYCDMNIKKVGSKFGKYEIISIENAVSLCRNDRTINVLIGVFDFETIKDIKEIIKKSFPVDVKVVVGHDIQTKIENKRIQRFHQSMVFRWEIDFKKYFEIWLDNIMSEVEYWVKDVASVEGRSHKYYLKCRENQEFFHKFISPDVKGGEVIMDIGCGLISRFGNQLHNGNAVKLIPVDALAHFYNCINSKISDGLKQDYFCCFGLFEFIGNTFGKNYADYIIINNALDHSIDPWKSLIECLYILKQGGSMYLRHRRAEAIYENWQGLHRWNIDCENGDLVIWNEKNAVNVTEKLKKYAEINVSFDGKENSRNCQMINIKIMKKGDIDLERFFDIQEENKVLIWCIDKLVKKLALDSNEFFQLMEQVQI